MLFDGSFANSTSVYRKEPSPAVDAAWEFLDHKIWSVTGSDIRRAHKDPAKSVKIDPSLMVADEREILEDLIVAAANDAKARAERVMQERMAEVTKGLPIPPGMKLF